MNKYEQLIEHIINEDEQAAKELFHQLVVEKSRDIYESLMDEEIGGNQAQGFVQDITNQDSAAQDQGLGEDDDMELSGEDDIGTEDDMDDMDDMDHEETFGDDGDMGGEEGEHNEIESKIDDLSAQLDDLKAMLAGDSDMGGDDMGGDDMGGEEPEMGNDFDMDHEEPEHDMEDMNMESANPFAKSGKSGSGKSGSGMSGSGVKEAKKMSGSGMSGSGKSGSGKSGSGKMESYKKTDVEIMKEYVDKIGEIYKQEPASGEGKTVGTGGDAPTLNKKSVSLEKGPDFGGTSENILSGKGDNVAPDGKAYTAPNNEYTKKRGELPGAGQFKNVPGGNAGKTSFKTKEPGHGAEKVEKETGKLVGADGSRPINKTSVQKQNTGKK